MEAACLHKAGNRLHACRVPGCVCAPVTTNGAACPSPSRPPGVSMAAELRRQLAQPGRQPGARPGAAPPAFAYGGVPPPPYQQPRDLLGRRLARAASSSGPQHWPGAGAGLRLPPALPRSTTWASREGSQGPSSPAGSTASSQAKSFAPPAVAPLTAELQLRRAQTFNMPPPAAQQSGLGLGLPVVGADATPNGFGAPPAAAAGPHSCSAAARPAWRVYADGRGADAPLWPGGDAAAEGAPAGEACLPDSRGAPDAAELRRGLLAGLRRTCHARRMQGLLSAEVRGCCSGVGGLAGMSWQQSDAWQAAVSCCGPPAALDCAARSVCLPCPVTNHPTAPPSHSMPAPLHRACGPWSTASPVPSSKPTCRCTCGAGCWCRRCRRVRDATMGQEAAAQGCAARTLQCRGNRSLQSQQISSHACGNSVTTVARTPPQLHHRSHAAHAATPRCPCCREGWASAWLRARSWL